MKIRFYLWEAAFDSSRKGVLPPFCNLIVGHYDEQVSDLNVGLLSVGLLLKLLSYVRFIICFLVLREERSPLSKMRTACKMYDNAHSHILAEYGSACRVACALDILINCISSNDTRYIIAVTNVFHSIKISLHCFQSKINIF
jgi:hypothetical protein